MKRIFLIISAILFTTISYALPPRGADEYKTYFIWKDSQPLQWKDFQGEPIPNSAEAAMTASSVEFSYYIKNNQIGWDVVAKYYPKLSWSKKPEQSDYILKHEQGHFDITELYARLFRKRLSEQVKTAKDVQTLKTIGKQIMQQWQEEQNDYDKETQHSVNEQKQTEWSKNLAERLNALKEFASK